MRTARKDCCQVREREAKECGQSARCVVVVVVVVGGKSRSAFRACLPKLLFPHPRIGNSRRARLPTTLHAFNLLSRGPLYIEAARFRRNILFSFNECSQVLTVFFTRVDNPQN